MNALEITLWVLIVALVALAFALARVVTRTERRMDLMQELRDEELRRTWKAKD